MLLQVWSLTFSGTNIESALREGLRFLAEQSSDNAEVRSTVIVFLTDGEATKGVTNKKDILESVRRHNEARIPIFSLAFGRFADYELVKKIAIQNDGFGRKIYQASDAAMQITGFYNEISVTLMSNVTFHYLDAPVQNLTKHVYPNYFNGSEVVVCGRISDTDMFQNALNGILKMVITGETSFGQKNITPTADDIVSELPDDNVTYSVDFETMTEKVWAYLTIKQKLDDMVGAMDESVKEKLRQEALSLSLKVRCLWWPVLG